MLSDVVHLDTIERIATNRSHKCFRLEIVPL